jgi:murein DD-endopeptidase MepM/ murein hydrolase activator NlpD
MANWATPIHAQVYKYKDENGQWVFTDKKPVDTQADELDIETKSEKTEREPQFFRHQYPDHYENWVRNPLHAPIEIKVQFEDTGLLVHRTVEAQGKLKLNESPLESEPFTYWWAIGDPRSAPRWDAYEYPIARHGDYTITQSFNGGFSHKREPSRNAVDISLPVGTDIAAARDGVVISVRDDYQFGGKNGYFLDKANHVTILHDDGTYALYAHLLVGSVKVELGQRVAAGQVIGRSGNSGYSSGPHLHFVVQVNVGLKIVSVPFKFQDPKGAPFTPKRGQILKVR